MNKLEKNIENCSPDTQSVGTLSIFCCDSVIFEEALLSIIQQEDNDDMKYTLEEYGRVLMDIHNRLLLDGYKYINEKYYKN